MDKRNRGSQWVFGAGILITLLGRSHLSVPQSAEPQASGAQCGKRRR